MTLLLDPLFWASLGTGLLAWRLRLGFVPHLLASMALLAWAARLALSRGHAAADPLVGLALWTLGTAVLLMTVEAIWPTRTEHGLGRRIAARASTLGLWGVRRASETGSVVLGASRAGTGRVQTRVAAGRRVLKWRPLFRRTMDALARLAGLVHEEPIERVQADGTLYAIIIRASFREPGVNFVTPPESQFQVGVLTHPLGRVIKAHVHKTRPQQVDGTPEVLLVREGKVRTDFYRPDGAYVASRTLHAGDTILLLDGGHGFEVLEPCVMVEVKQGPYRGVAEDKRLLDDKP